MSRTHRTFNANTTQAGRHVTAEELLFVLDGWHGHDDWGVETYPYPGTVLDLLGHLHAGDNPRALRLIGKVAEGRWYFRVLAAACPDFYAHTLVERGKALKG